MEDKNQEMTDTKRPNVFLAVPLDCPALLSSLQEVAAACEAHQKDLGRLRIPSQKIHITLLVTNVQEEELPQAREIVERTLRDKVVRDLAETSFEVELKGVGSFGNRVVFAKIEKGILQLKKLNEAFHVAFKDAGFECDPRPYAPHVTLLKVMGRNREGIPSAAYGEFTERVFGSQTVRRVDLLSMTKWSDGGGYYREGEYNFQDLAGDQLPPALLE